MSEQIINPAPPLTNVSEPSSNGNQSLPSDKALEKQENAIRSLTRDLRIINNICEPICEYSKFQQSIKPELRVLIDINQLIGLIYGLKSAVKSNIDSSYLDIKDPPEILKEAMLKTYDSIDHASQSIEKSMKEMIDMIQSNIYSSSHVSFNKVETKPDILTEMSSNNRLP